MSQAPTYSSDIAFTPTVKAIQARRGSRQSYGRMEEKGGWQTDITDDLAAFIAAQRSLYIATANAEGQPYIQHRGGQPSFLKVQDRKTLAFADYRGNRQYITLGNLADNPKACLFLMDYANRRRIKIWGDARVVEGDPTLLAELMAPGETAVPEQAILFTVRAWDANCPQHIPQLVAVDDVAAELERRARRIAELEAELAQRSSAGSAT